MARLTPDEAAGARRSWLAGRCPCCGSSLTEWPGPDGTEHQPRRVAEGVMFCGRCIGNQHYEPDDFLDALLRSLVP